MNYPQLPDSWSAWEITRLLEEKILCKVYEARCKEQVEQQLAIISIYHIPHNDAIARSMILEKGSQEAAQMHFRLEADTYIQNLKLQEKLRACPTIVRLEDYALEENQGGIGWTIFARTEHVDSFYSYCNAHHPISESEVLRLGINVCEALAFCQDARILRYGIDNGSIYVTKDGIFKLGDFDYAVRANEIPSDMVGTQLYQAPEVIKSRVNTHATLLYSLGILMYSHLNQNRLPFFRFGAPNSHALEMRLNGTPMPPPVDASPEMAAVILKACAYRQEDRYQTAAEFLQALTALSASENTENTPAPHETMDVENTKKKPFSWIRIPGRQKASSALSSLLPQSIAPASPIQQPGAAAVSKTSDRYIFISYAHRDKDMVVPIIARLVADGYRVWYDDGIDPGTEWDEDIASHVEHCHLFVALISAAYLASENCKDELIYARDLNKKRILIYLEKAELPGGLKMRLNRLQAIHLYAYPDQENFFQRLYAVSDMGECHQ